MKRKQTTPGRPRRPWSKQLSRASRSPLTKHRLTYNRDARLILESYWKKIGGKPTIANKISKKRSRQSLSNNGSTDTPKPKKGRKSKQANVSRDDTPEPPAGFTEVGDDDWKPPPPNKDAWDPLVQAIDTIERDEAEELWAYLVWNDKTPDGRFYRSKAKVPTCNQACPQRVCDFHFLSLLVISCVTVREPDACEITDAPILRKTRRVHPESKCGRGQQRASCLTTVIFTREILIIGST